MEDLVIDPSRPYAAHIALTCVNHLNLRWSTKNISHIGARTVFYNLFRENPGIPECTCPFRDLTVVTPVMEAADLIARHYGYRDHRAYAYLLGFAPDVLWSELDKLTRS